jgi:hypothetical protein
LCLLQCCLNQRPRDIERLGLMKRVNEIVQSIALLMGKLHLFSSLKYKAEVHFVVYLTIQSAVKVNLS